MPATCPGCGEPIGCVPILCTCTTPHTRPEVYVIVATEDGWAVIGATQTSGVCFSQVFDSRVEAFNCCANRARGRRTTTPGWLSRAITDEFMGVEPSDVSDVSYFARGS